MGAMLVVAIALFVLGGGDDESFAEEVEAVCVAANEDVIASQVVLPPDPTDEQKVAWLGVVYVDLQRERVTALRALDEYGDDDEFTALVDDHEAAVDRLEADPAHFVEDAEADPFAEMKPRWESFGATSCGGLTSD